MNKGEKIKVYFKMNGRCYLLFNVIQMGENGLVDLKITDFYNNFVIFSKKSNDEKGYWSEEEFNESKFVYRAEMSYHKDGTFLHKISDGSKPEYSNPYGQGIRWTPTNCIEDFQPVMYIAIRDISLYSKSCLRPTLKSKETAYICENDDLFEKTGTYFVILYIRNKKLPVNCYTGAKLYSDVITELNEELDLCIFIQRHHYPMALPYYSKIFKCMVTPYLYNSINFCNRESAKDEMKNVLGNTVFDSTFHRFLLAMTDGRFINLSEDKLQFVDQINIMYEEYKGKISVSKPVFIKIALSLLGNNLSEFNKLNPIIKQSFLQLLYKAIIDDRQNK